LVFLSFFKALASLQNTALLHSIFLIHVMLLKNYNYINDLAFLGIWEPKMKIVFSRHIWILRS